MSRLVRRGRAFFLILATLIVVDRLSSIVLAFIGDTENLSLWRSVLSPGLVILGVVSLWQGETWLRWLMAAWSLMHGGTNLLILAVIMYRMAAVTPPEQTGFFLNMSAMLFWFPLLHASFYISTGLALLLSRSLNSFFDHQQKTAENPLTALMRWILGFIKIEQSDDDGRQRFFGMIDKLNAEAGGGEPKTIEQHLGSLTIRSGILSFGDPQDLSSVEIPNIDSDEVSISAKLWQYPSDGATVIGLTINIGNGSHCDPPRKVGELGIDSAAIIVADKADIDEYWTETGKDRIGVISTAPDDTLLRKLKKRFKFKTVQINPVRAEVVGPVSATLEQEIENYLKSIPEYAQFPFMHFHVQTNNSFDRANYTDKPWDFMPVGNEDRPLMFVCGTGRGDGRYDVNCRYSGNAPRIVSINFVDDDGDE